MRVVVVLAAFALVLACQTAPPPADDGHGMLTPYTLTLRYFSNSEALTIVDVMSQEFPGYRSHDLISRSGTVRHYQYLTTAKVFKLEEWLYVLFGRMGLDSERDVLIQVEGATLVVDKLGSARSRPIGPDDRPRFR